MASCRRAFASVHPERITIADNGFGPGDITWNGVFNNTQRDDHGRRRTDA